MEVPDEAAAVMEECRLCENRQEGRKSYYHVYSMDRSPGIENHAMFLVQSPENLIIREIDEAADYRSGERLVNERDGMTHDFTKKGGVVHTEIMLPAHAPPAFADRSTLWNSVEEIEKSSTAQLAREIESGLAGGAVQGGTVGACPGLCQRQFSFGWNVRRLRHPQQGNRPPHAHILLTIRPIKENGEWGAKCRKVYDLDGQGQRIPDGKGGWKSHREDTTEWNHRGSAEKRGAAWAAYTNRALEAAGRPERIDH